MKVSSRFKVHQDALPRLPVPPLQQSLDHYLRALQPIVSEEEWAQTKKLVDEFQTSGGVGERLQKGLERRAKKTENWVSEMAGCTGPQLPEGSFCGLLSAAHPESSLVCNVEFAEHLPGPDMQQVLGGQEGHGNQPLRADVDTVQRGEQGGEQDAGQWARSFQAGKFQGNKRR